MELIRAEYPADLSVADVVTRFTSADDATISLIRRAEADYNEAANSSAAAKKLHRYST